MTLNVIIDVSSTKKNINKLVFLLIQRLWVPDSDEEDDWRIDHRRLWYPPLHRNLYAWTKRD